MKIQKTKLLCILALLMVLVGAFLWGGSAPGLQQHAATDSPLSKEGGSTLSSSTASPTSPTAEAPAVTPPTATPPAPGKSDSLPAADITRHPDGANNSLPVQEKVDVPKKAPNAPSATEKGDPQYSEKNGMDIHKDTGKDAYQTAPVPEGKPVPVEPENTTISDTPYTCTLSIRCDTILSHMDWLNAEKTQLVPADGVIYPTTTVTFYEGESVFHVLLRELKKNKIHLEFSNTPIYNSAYIEGIQNLYEFDCGELSGWRYKVNGWFPNYGSSRYQLKQGDTIEWVYTCDLGADVGAATSMGG